MFKNITIYRIAAGLPLVPVGASNPSTFAECGAIQQKSVGFVPPRGHAHGALDEVIDGQHIMAVMIQTKAVPAEAICKRVDAAVAQIEAQTGRKPGKTERRELINDAHQALMPHAFPHSMRIFIWVDPVAGLLVVDSTSKARLDDVTTLLVKTFDGLTLQALCTETAPAAAMAYWLMDKEGPSGFSIDRECELKACDESKAVVRYGRHALDTDEVSQHVAMGKMPTRLALTWADRVSYLLTHNLQLKKLAFLDAVFEGTSTNPGDRSEDHFDADVAIATGELRKLIPALISALGGEAR